MKSGISRMLSKHSKRLLGSHREVEKEQAWRMSVSLHFLSIYACLRYIRTIRMCFPRSVASSTHRTVGIVDSTRDAADTEPRQSSLANATRSVESLHPPECHGLFAGSPKAKDNNEEHKVWIPSGPGGMRKLIMSFTHTGQKPSAAHYG